MAELCNWEPVKESNVLYGYEKQCEPGVLVNDLPWPVRNKLDAVCPSCGKIVSVQEGE